MVPVIILRARWSPCRDGRERLRLCPRGLYGAPSWDSNCPANGRHAAVLVKQPNVMTWTAEAWRRASFWHTTPAAQQTAATRHSITLVGEVRPPSDSEIPTTRTPPNDTAHPRGQ